MDAVSGYNLEFVSLPNQFNFRQTRLNAEDGLVLDLEITKLLEKGVIELTSHSSGEFISTVFLRPKKDGGKRMILNLSTLNEHIEYNHFKMERLESAMQLMTKNCFMGSIDLRDAYYSVRIHPESRKYLRFIWRDKLYQFTALPNGYSAAPRLFTKLLKPIYAKLRSEGYISVAYIDDSYLQGSTYEECLDNINNYRTWVSGSPR